MNNLQTFIPKEWASLCNIPLLNKIEEKIDWSETIYPTQENIFRALSTHPNDIKVVILGQDPYHGPNQAMGLSFSVPKDVKLPPSLRNIFKEIESTTEFRCKSGDLTSWANQGVLLLNSILTVKAAQPASHQKTGWIQFTEELLIQLSHYKKDIVFLLWGSFAQKQAQKLNKENNHFFLEAPHPSPLSAHRGFLGCQHFVKANEFLTQTGQKPIDWSTDYQVELGEFKLSAY